jgi:AcrR family transcriptional regulator
VPGPPVERRDGEGTREAAQRIATELFIRQGYDVTSLREIAGALGIKKASLYYHFASKEAIAESVLAARLRELDDLTAWASAQPAGPDRIDATVLRWIGDGSGGKVRGVRFVNANPALIGRMEGSSSFPARFGALIRVLIGDDAGVWRRQLVSMALLSINAAVMADPGGLRTDDEILAAAREMAEALLARLRR